MSSSTGHCWTVWMASGRFCGRRAANGPSRDFIRSDCPWPEAPTARLCLRRVIGGCRHGGPSCKGVNLAMRGFERIQRRAWLGACRSSAGDDWRVGGQGKGRRWPKRVSMPWRQGARTCRRMRRSGVWSPLDPASGARVSLRLPVGSSTSRPLRLPRPPASADCHRSAARPPGSRPASGTGARQ